MRMKTCVDKAIDRDQGHGVFEESDLQILSLQV